MTTTDHGAEGAEILERGIRTVVDYHQAQLHALLHIRDQITRIANAVSADEGEGAPDVDQTRRDAVDAAVDRLARHLAPTVPCRCGWVHQLRTYDDLAPVEREALREAVLPLAEAALGVTGEQR